MTMKQIRPLSSVLLLLLAFCWVLQSFVVVAFHSNNQLKSDAFELLSSLSLSVKTTRTTRRRHCYSIPTTTIGSTAFGWMSGSCKNHSTELVTRRSGLKSLSSLTLRLESGNGDDAEQQQNESSSLSSSNREEESEGTTHNNSNNNNSSSSSSSSNKMKKKPKIIVFDLDGCLWRPEMYELIWFSGGRGAPFRPNPDKTREGTLLTCGDEVVSLLRDIAQIMKELQTDSKWKKNGGVLLGISSRTDEPDWARELLTKFKINIGEGGGGGSTDDSNIIRSEEDNRDDKKNFISLQQVFDGGPIEISKDSKIKHFQRISQNCNVPLRDILFFDNESGNCREVATLGVTVAYCPNNVTNEIWRVALEAFPQSGGKVVGLDVYGYDTLEGAQRLL